MSYANIVTENMVLVIDTTTGEEVKFFSTDKQFAAALDLIQQGKQAEVFKLSTAKVIVDFAKASTDKSVSIQIIDGAGVIILKEFNDMEVPLNDAIVDRILKMQTQGVDVNPLVNFLGKLYRNPSQTAIAELYQFIAACELPITEDGDFIAYKMVKNDYMDIYSGTMSNKVGEVLQMPRGMVDDNRHNTCSRGLHFCSKEYLNAYGSTNRLNDRCMLVKINPEDVVSIPSDYNNAKGRAWRYVVVGEVADGWRDTLPQKDYTDAAVVQNDGRANDTSGDYKEGYIQGWKDHKQQKQNRVSFVTPRTRYHDGYDAAFKDRAAKKRAKFLPQ